MAEPPFGHESSAIAVRRVLLVGATLALAVTLVVIAVSLALGPRLAPARRAALSATPLPPAPRLQAQPATELAAVRQRERALLEVWGWADAEHRFARIPIERAMQIYARQHGGAHGCDAPPQRVRAPPQLLERVGFEQRLGAPVPGNIELRDAQARPVRLADLFGGRPTLLVPGYFGCRNLCGLVRAGVAYALGRSGLAPGRDFNVVLVSVDPRETAADAAAAQNIDAAAAPEARVQRWHYLTGAAAASAALSQAVGFRYLPDARTGQYAHAAGVVVLTPQGTVAQYLFGVQFAPQTLRLALVAAAHGGIGTLADRLLLLCCDYDPTSGRYSLLISRVLAATGLATALALAALLAGLRRAERLRAARAAP